MPFGAVLTAASCPPASRCAPSARSHGLRATQPSAARRRIHPSHPGTSSPRPSRLHLLHHLHPGACGRVPRACDGAKGPREAIRPDAGRGTAAAAAAGRGARAHGRRARRPRCGAPPRASPLGRRRAGARAEVWARGRPARQRGHGLPGASSSRRAPAGRDGLPQLSAATRSRRELRPTAMRAGAHSPLQFPLHLPLHTFLYLRRAGVVRACARPAAAPRPRAA
jgi:hypothetical protein